MYDLEPVSRRRCRPHGGRCSTSLNRPSLISRTACARMERRRRRDPQGVRPPDHGPGRHRLPEGRERHQRMPTLAGRLRRLDHWRQGADRARAGCTSLRGAATFGNELFDRSGQDPSGLEARITLFSTDGPNCIGAAQCQGAITFTAQQAFKAKALNAATYGHVTPQACPWKGILLWQDGSMLKGAKNVTLGQPERHISRNSLRAVARDDQWRVGDDGLLLVRRRAACRSGDLVAVDSHRRRHARHMTRPRSIRLELCASFTESNTPAVHAGLADALAVPTPGV